MHHQALYAVVVDARRKGVGPYTAAAALVRQLVVRAHEAAPDLVRAHALTLLSVVPDLAEYVPVPEEVVRSFAFSREGNQRGWTLRIAHGLTDFILGTLGGGGAEITFENVEHADPTDREFIAVLERRAPPAQLVVKSFTSTTTAGPLLRDPGVTVDSALAASTHCMRMAYYDSALVWAHTGRRLIASKSGSEYGELTRHALFALLLLGRFDDVEDLCAEARAHSTDAALLAHTAYATAILNVRLYEKSRRDYDAAALAIAASRAFTEQLPPSPSRSVNLAFLQNTKALVEMRRGHPDGALALVSEAIDYLAREAPTEFALESQILFHNRARVHVAAGRLQLAIDDLTTLLGHEPSNSDAYFDRAVLHQRTGDLDLALKDYEAAIVWSPPYYEPHFNRAQILGALGRSKEARAEYEYVLALEPEHIEALVNRACASFELRDFDAAQTDVDRALSLGPATARLGCLQGLLQLRRGELDAAEATFTNAIQREPSLADGWANRASVRFKRKHLEAARLDLTQALALREDATILENRGRVLEAEQRWEEAIADYSRAIVLASGAAARLARRRERCLFALASRDARK